MAEETSFTQVTVSPAVQPTPDHGSAASAPASSGRPALAGTAPASGPTARTNTGNREVAHMGPTTLGTGSRGLASSGSALRLKAVMQQEMASLRQEKLLRPETLVASLRDVRSEWADLRKEARAIFTQSPGMSVQSLSYATLTCALIQVFFVVGWLVYFGTRDWDVESHPGSRANTLSNSTRDRILIVGGVLQALAFITVLGGSQSGSIPALMAGHVLQLGVLSLVHIGYDNTGVRVFALLTDLFVLAGAWAVIMQHEMEQSLRHEKRGMDRQAMYRRGERLRGPVYVVALLNIVCGIAGMSVGGLPFDSARGFALLVVGLLSAAVALVENRRLHNLLYLSHIVMATFHIGPLSFALQKVSTQEVACTHPAFDTSPTDKAKCTGNQSDANIFAIVTTVSIFTTLTGAWLHMQKSAAIQDTTRTAEKPWMFGLSMTDSVATTTKLVYALTPVQLILGVVLCVQSGDYDSDAMTVEVGMGGFSYTVGIAIIVAALVGIGSAYKQHLSVLVLSYTMQEALLSVCFLGLAYAGNVIVANSTNNVPPILETLAIDQAFLVAHPVTAAQESKFEASIVVTTLAVFSTTLYAFLLFDLHEFLQDTHKTRSFAITDKHRRADPRPQAFGSSNSLASRSSLPTDDSVVPAGLKPTPSMESRHGRPQRLVQVASVSSRPKSAGDARREMKATSAWVGAIGAGGAKAAGGPPKSSPPKSRDAVSSLFGNDAAAAQASPWGGSGKLKLAVRAEIGHIRMQKLLSPHTFVSSLTNVRADFEDLRQEARSIFKMNPTASVQALANATLTCAIVQVFFVVGWLVYFGTRDWNVDTNPGSRANTLSNGARDQVLVIGAFLEVLALVAVVWGSQGHSIPALMAGHVLQLGVLSLVHIGYDNTGVRVFALLTDIVVLGGAWAVMQQHEMEQSMRHERRSTARRAIRKRSACLRAPTYLVAVLNFVCGAAIALVGSLPFSVAQGAALFVVAIGSVFGGFLENRRVHNVLYLAHVAMATFSIGPLTLSMQKGANQEAACNHDAYAADANLKLECDGKVADANSLVLFTIISVFSTLAGAWLHTQSSATIQDMTRKAEKPWMFGLSMTDSVATTTKLVYALTPVQLILGVVLCVQSGDYDSDAMTVEVGMGGFSYTVGIAIIVAALVGIGSAYKQHLSVLVLSYTMQEALLSVCFLGLAYAGNVIVANSTNNVPPILETLAIDQAFLVAHPVTAAQESKFEASIVVTTLAVFSTTLYAFLLFDLHEFLQDTHKTLSFQIADHHRRADRARGALNPSRVADRPAVGQETVAREPPATVSGAPPSRAADRVTGFTANGEAGARDEQDPTDLLIEEMLALAETEATMDADAVALDKRIAAKREKRAQKKAAAAATRRDTLPGTVPQ